MRPLRISVLSVSFVCNVEGIYIVQFGVILWNYVRVVYSFLYPTGCGDIDHVNRHGAKSVPQRVKKGVPFQKYHISPQNWVTRPVFGKFLNQIQTLGHTS